MAKTINTIINLRDKFTEKMKQISNQTKEQSRQMKLLGNNIKAFRQNAVSGFIDVAKKAVGLGVAFAGINAAAETLKNGVDFIKDYQSSLTNLQAATGASNEEIKQMKEQITDLYKINMGSSWEDLADAMTLTKQVTGQMGDQLKQTTALAVTYRDTFGADIAESIKTADTMMKNFGISSTQAYNLLAQGAQKGLDKSGELLDTANEYSVYFKNLGFSANQMFDMFSAGLEKGAFNLDKVGDAVKEFEIRSKDMSKTTIQAYQALGFNAKKMSETLAKGGPDAQKAFKKVVNAITSIKDPVKKNTIGVQLFGTQFEDMEKDVIAALGTARSQFDMTKRTMSEVNKIKYNSTTQAFKGIGRMVETSVLIPIADRLLPKLNKVGQWFSDNMPKIKAGIDKTFTTGEKVIAGFTKSISWAKDNVNWLIPIVSGLTAAIATQKVIGVVSGMYKSWTAVTKGMTIAQTALNIVMSANPFGLIALSIGALVAGGIALWKNWDTVKAKASELWAWLSGTWTNIKTSTINAFSGMSENVKGSFSSIVDSIKAPINAVISMVNKLIDNINDISFTVPDWVPGIGGESLGVNISKIPSFALGTSYFTGGLARINERGGEIVSLPNGTQVIPADKSEKIINNSDRNITIHISVQGNLIGEEEEVNRIMSKAIMRLQTTLSNA